MRSSPPARRYRFLPLLVACASGLLHASIDPSPSGAQEAPSLLLAFSSYREDLGYPRIYFYRHDGAATGSIAGGIPPGPTRSDHRPALARGGRLCAWTSEVVGKVSQIGLWDLVEKKDLPLPSLGAGVADLGPAMNGEGSWLAFSSWRRPGPGGWDLFFYERETQKLTAPEGLNSDQDDRMPALSRDGRYLAFSSSRTGGAGLSDIYLYDRQASALVPLPGLNGPTSEIEPSISGDGRWIAFVSARPGGTGQLDLHLYDRTTSRLVPLPGLNSPAPEQAPSLTADGRYLAFVSERLEGAGHRDIHLYDIEKQKLLPLPGLNSPRDDVDPAIIQAQ